MTFTASTATTSSPPTVCGCGFLCPGNVAPVRTPEDVDEEHRAIARSVGEFWRGEIAPALDALRRHEPGVGPGLLRKAAALGLTGLHIPEGDGGAGLDLAGVMLVIDQLANDPSYLGWHLAHSGIGTLPLALYGTAAQRARYLPRLANAELIAAYALTEPQAGSDALGIRLRAELNAAGTHYVLNGQKMWITNGGAADLFTVFARVGGEHFTAFLVERAFGVRSGAEEHKMGLEGTSTTALFFDDVAVPVENVLGEVGRGHHIAFNVLNIGRLEIGPNMTRSGTRVLDASLEHVRERHAFGAPLAALGAIQHKIADMAIRIFAAEAVTWRVVGLLDTRLAATHGAATPAATVDAFEEFAAECSIVKVCTTEALDTVVDEGVQIHGGVGYHRDHPVERAYRDARINRIFEGTNEINRIFIARTMFRRASDGRLSNLAGAAAAVVRHATTGRTPAPPGTPDEIVEALRSFALLAVGLALARHGDGREAPQEVLMLIADLAIDLFAAEAVVARGRRLTAAGRASPSDAMVTVHLHDTLARAAYAARTAAAALVAPQDAAPVSAFLTGLAACEVPDTVALRRAVAAGVLGAGRYTAG